MGSVVWPSIPDAGSAAGGGADPIRVVHSDAPTRVPGMVGQGSQDNVTIEAGNRYWFLLSPETDQTITEVHCDVAAAGGTEARWAVAEVDPAELAVVDILGQGTFVPSGTFTIGSLDIGIDKGTLYAAMIGGDSVASFDLEYLGYTNPMLFPPLKPIGISIRTAGYFWTSDALDPAVDWALPIVAPVNAEYDHGGLVMPFQFTTVER